MAGIYEEFREACARKGTTITAVLKAIGKSDGSTGSWKAGKYPLLDTVIEIAEYLDISLDELVFGSNAMAKKLTENEREWLTIIEHIPDDKQEMMKDFMRTHAVIPAKYADKGKKNHSA